jgi:hypothetical protein
MLALCVRAELKGVSVIRGTVIDQETRDPIHFANVFLANTTIGTATTPAGQFELKHISPGSYHLVIHHIAYEPKIIEIDLLTEKQLGLVVELTPRVISGEAVEVVGRREKAWRKHLKTFQDALLGQTENAGSCEILNPVVLDFRIEKGWLIADSDSILCLRNQALGYELKFVLGEFRCTSDEKKYTIYPAFKPMQSTHDDDRLKWQKNRETAYLGSFRHLIRSFYLNTLSKEGFELYDVKIVGKKVITWGATDRIDEPEDLVRPSIFLGLKELHLEGHLMVLSHDIPRKTDLFLDEAINSNFIQLEFFEPSFVTMNVECALIDALGNVHSPSPFSISGYWSDYGVADLLPFDYLPDE